MRSERPAAPTLEIEQYLERKPRQFSGGQRQRVAMGRAIVREPSAFLFDEPLSNLDAKLRVQMRVEIKRLQDGRIESLQTSSLHLDMLRDLKRINAHIVSVAHPILDESGLLIESRLKAAE